MVGVLRRGDCEKALFLADVERGQEQTAIATAGVVDCDLIGGPMKRERGLVSEYLVLLLVLCISLALTLSELSRAFER